MKPTSTENHVVSRGPMMKASDILGVREAFVSFTLSHYKDTFQYPFDFHCIVLFATHYWLIPSFLLHLLSFLRDILSLLNLSLLIHSFIHPSTRPYSSSFSTHRHQSPHRRHRWSGLQPPRSPSRGRRDPHGPRRTHPLPFPLRRTSARRHASCT